VSPAQLLGAFEHGTAYAYDCTVTGQCTAEYPGTATPLLHLPLAVLTDRDCLSACEAFSGAVKDLHLGTLIGTRTAGIIAGPTSGWALDDGSTLALPAEHDVGADHELINGIGVAPDFSVPRTAQDLATGHDADVARALALLRA
jgi:carboxyl-terminal processing protease